MKTRLFIVNQEGFTLLEVLVAFLLLSVMLTLFFQTQVGNITFATKLKQNDSLECALTERLACIERHYEKFAACNLSGKLSVDSAVPKAIWNLSSQQVELFPDTEIYFRDLTFSMQDPKTKKKITKILRFPDAASQEEFQGETCEEENLVKLCPEILNTCQVKSTN